MKEMPSFINKKGSDKEVLRVPSQYHPSLVVMDIVNLQNLLSTLVKVTLTLADLLKVKPELWHEITSFLGKMGVPVPKLKPIQMNKELVKKATKCELVTINKVGDCCEGEDGNTTLPVEFNDVKSLVILDSGIE